MSNSRRRRLDQALVDRGMAPSRTLAADLVQKGLVLVSGVRADKPSRLVASGEPVVISGGVPRFVGRGGEKLDAALSRFRLDVSGLVVLDAGSSTGGFTDCLLRRGARRVVAVDVGHGQLHPRLRADSRVDVRERTDIRDVADQVLNGPPVDAVTADLSFISITRALPVITGRMVVPGAPLVLLVKPQFEAGRAEASKARGVIRDPSIHRRTLREVTGALVGAGAAIMEAMPSPITGSAGNIEFFVHARSPGGACRHPGSALDPEHLGAHLDAVVDESRTVDTTTSAAR
ncbi:MAG: TlyA family RNA methyltransferase [Acidimicrobiales bacterium]